MIQQQLGQEWARRRLRRNGNLLTFESNLFLTTEACKDTIEIEISDNSINMTWEWFCETVCVTLVFLVRLPEFQKKNTSFTLSEEEFVWAYNKKEKKVKMVLG